VSRPATDSAPPKECDIAIVGGGIIGLSVARELLLRLPGARLCVLEAEPQIGRHQTGRSSGVVHAGIYYAPGSLKARLCVEGMRELYAYCDERGVPYKRSGKLIVATAEEELPRLDELERRGVENRVEGLRRLAGEEIPEVEPHARGIAALHSPATGVVDFVAVARAYGDDVAAAGGSVHLGAEVRGAAPNGEGMILEHAGGATAAGQAVFCAGLWSDRLAVACGAPQDPRIVPFRGAYLRVEGDADRLVRANVYPVPDPDLPFLGAHLTRNFAGELLIGPSALLAPARDAYRLRTIRPRDVAATVAWPGTWRLMRRHWRTGLEEIRRAASRRSFVAEAARFVPEMRGARVSHGPAGIRAQALARDGQLVDDFVLHRTEHAVHVRNAPSPAATSSLALARLIADRLEE
jgi:2-hydroxyglutarate dehydrogenase